MADTRKERGETRGRPFEVGNPGRPRGSRNKASLLREDVVRAILAEKDRRDAEAEEQGISGGWMATLDDKDFLVLIKAIIPRNADTVDMGYGTVLAALQAKARGE